MQGVIKMKNAYNLNVYEKRWVPLYYIVVVEWVSVMELQFNFGKTCFCVKIKIFL